jgi:hypothetical protein
MDKQGVRIMWKKECDGKICVGLELEKSDYSKRAS